MIEDSLLGKMQGIPATGEWVFYFIYLFLFLYIVFVCLHSLATFLHVRITACLYMLVQVSALKLRQSAAVLNLNVIYGTKLRYARLMTLKLL